MQKCNLSESPLNISKPNKVNPDTRHRNLSIVDIYAQGKIMKTNRKHLISLEPFSQCKYFVQRTGWCNTNKDCNPFSVSCFRYLTVWFVKSVESNSLTYASKDCAGLRGYCTPGQFLDCFCIFLKNYNTLVTSKICFLKITFQGT